MSEHQDAPRVVPQVWMNKESGIIVIVVPQFIPVGDYTELKCQADDQGIPFVWGSFYQAGWMIENGQNVFFGFPMSVEDQFEKLGDL